MSLVRIAFLTQFQRDAQALRDSLIGLTQNQLFDPTFHPENTLAERLALLAAHYARQGEILAYHAGQQNDPPLEEDERWRMDVVQPPSSGWSLSQLQSELEDSWSFYEQMLRDVNDSQYSAYVQSHHGVLPRPAFELSREITTWRLHY
jgi:hypothetical protein